MSKKVMIVQGGWDGHEPVQVSARFKDMMDAEGFEATIYDDLDCFKDEEVLKDLHLIIPLWTMGKIEKEQLDPVINAVASGVGIAGCHGGMCDAFRDSVQWQFMTGGNWVSHPGGDGTPHRINIKNSSSPLVEGIKDFDISSEQYYLHVDPAVEVLATCRFPVAHWYHSANKEVDMPVVWTKRWGHGRVYYNSLGHHNDIFDIPEAKELMRRGLLWAAEGKDIAIRDNLDPADFESREKMF